MDIVEPTKLRADDVAALWRYWRDSQKINKRPVAFIEALPKDIRRHGDGERWQNKKVKSKVKGKEKANKVGSKVNRKKKAKRKVKYVEVDDGSESSSDEHSKESSEESSDEDDSEEDDDDDEEENVREVVKWGPPRNVKRNRPQVHLVTQEGRPGGSGLSAVDKQGLASSREKAKKDRREPIDEHEEDGSAEQDPSEAGMNQRPPADAIEMAAPGTPEPAGPHPGSPAACTITPEDRFRYLNQLSTNRYYWELLDMIDQEEVRLCFIIIISNIVLTHHPGKLSAYTWFPLLGFLVLRWPFPTS